MSATSDVIYVPSSQGGDDTASLINAIDQCTFPAGSSRRGTVVLAGDYNFSEQLNFGDIENRTTQPPALATVGNAVLNYTGPAMSDYAIRFGGTGITDARMADLRLNCNWQCRGILLAYQTYLAEFSRIYISHPVEVGFDAIDCWGIRAKAIMVFNCRGFGARFYRANSALIEHLHLSGYTAYHADDESSSTEWMGTSYALAQKRVADGDAAAEAFYGSDYKTKWPGSGTLANDTASLDYEGNAYACLDDTFKCMLLIDRCNNMRLQNLMIEGCYSGNDPVAIIYSAGTTIEELRFEANVAADLMWVYNYNATDVPSNGTGANNRISGVHCQEDGTVKTMLRFKGATKSNILENVISTGVSDSIVVHDGSSRGTVPKQHQGNVLRNINHDATSLVTVENSAVVTSPEEDLSLGSAQWAYWGDANTDGTWRQGRSGSSLVHQRRESSLWVTKQTITL